MFFSELNRTSFVLISIVWLMLPISACSVAEYTSTSTIEQVSTDDQAKQALPVVVAAAVIAGCRVPGCCPGCEQEDLLSWHLYVSGPPGSKVVLEFEQLPHGLRKHLRVEGGAQWRDDQSLILPVGESWLHGLRAHTATSPLVALPRAFAPDTITATTKALDKTLSPSAIRLSVVQYLGQSPVNDHEMVFDLGDLGIVREKAGDVIELHNNRGGDSAVLLVDGRRESGCTNDEIFRGDIRANVGNLIGTITECKPIYDSLQIRRSKLAELDVSPGEPVLQRGSAVERSVTRLQQEVKDLEVQLSACMQHVPIKPCNSEVVVFSDGNSMALLEDVDVWTRKPSDKLDIQLESMHRLPVTFWIMSDQSDMTNDHFVMTRARVHSDQLRANQIFDTYNCGIAFTTAAINEVRNDPGSTIPLEEARCDEAIRLSNEVGFVQNHLNVYYVSQTADTFDALGCGSHKILITPIAINEALAHEYGHWLTLGHIDTFDLDQDGVRDFPLTNLMMSGGISKYELTEGQCFRMNVSPWSVLNTLGSRTGPTRICKDIDINARCPAVFLDAKPD